MFMGKLGAGSRTGSQTGTLGTFSGVFTPSILTILGIILFLRLGYVVGSGGLFNALTDAEKKAKEAEKEAEGARDELQERLDEIKDAGGEEEGSEVEKARLRVDTATRRAAKAKAKAENAAKEVEKLGAAPPKIDDPSPTK
jgi:F0F1-type ATP synthase membrane subunit b/b'